MILAAGRGTRLRPLTNHSPKALVEIGGRTLLEITLKRIASYGIREVIVNAVALGVIIASAIPVYLAQRVASDAAGYG